MPQQFSSALETTVFFGNYLFAVAVGCAVIVVYGLYAAIQSTLYSSNHSNANGTPARKPSQQSSEDDPDEGVSNRVAVGLSSSSSKRRGRRIAWPKKISSYLKGRASTDDASPNSSGRVLLRRRHSTGPFHLARAAKDFIRGRRYRRQFSEFQRDAMPRPPTEFFEPSDMPQIPNNEKPEIFYILHNLKQLELPVDWTLDPKQVEVIEFEKDSYVLRPGDDDNAMYVVLEGTCTVYISHAEGKEYLVKRIERGNSFFSLLSMLDILTMNESKFKTVSLRTVQRTKIAKFSIDGFRESYLRDPQAWARPIQIVITRLLHVTMTTLHQYLGLSSELTKRISDDKRSENDRLRHTSGQSLSQRLSTKLTKARTTRINSVDEGNHEVMVTARRWFAEALNLSAQDVALVRDRITLETVTEGHVFIEQGTDENQQLIMVVSGALKLMQDPVFDEDEELDENDKWYTLLLARELVGGLQLLTSEPAFYTVKAASTATVAIMSKKHFAELLDLRPNIVLPVAHSVLRRLSPFLRGVDFALDWVLLDSGQAVYRQGDQADSLFVVLSGRLRSVDKKTIVEEFGKGDMMGMVEVLQKKPRSTTVLAVRFSQLALVPEGLLNFIKLQFPQVGFRLVHLLGQYYSQSSRRTPLMTPSLNAVCSAPSSADPMSHIKNLHTIAVVPASEDVPLAPFTCELYHALNANLKVLRLSSKKVAEHLDASVLEKQADFRLMHWLNVQEDTYPLVIYECDYNATNWTRRCLRQADAILVVANGDKKPFSKHFVEEHLNMNQDGIRTNKELILLWREGTAGPTGTFEWLKGSWFSGHHHVRTPNRMRQWDELDLANREKEVIEYYEHNVFCDKVDFNSDFSRLARILTGNAVGLVLGGGGARGAAHVGIIRAMREHGIPVDIVGGTSIGSMIGGLFAEAPEDNLEPRAKSWFVVMTSLWKKIWDLTYAHSAMFTGAGFNKTLQDLFGDKDIDDLWIPYFCITTDISTSEMRICRTGSLWAYTRASMSLAGYLPPLCDPSDGHLLLDGGYVNNLPADVMRQMGAKCVIACDVGSATETNLYNYGDTLSGMWVLWKRLNPWAEPVRILGMEEIQSRLAFVSCVRQLEMVKKAPYCHYLRPPIENFKTLDFAKFDTICDVGYQYGTSVFDDLVKNNQHIKSVMNPDKLKAFTKTYARRTDHSKMERSCSFTDLAARMSKIPRVRSNNSVTDFSAFETDDEFWEDYEQEDGEQGFDNASEAEDDLRVLTPRNGGSPAPLTRSNALSS
ncbi:hypothetical protein QR680_013118 [Steinernema hermaphroditum]|uniref:Neuropathy target esterase sws n=1 Tax=Steinernema hermaphroditum TaxID=289476 RepID=A0AA39I6S1_9BILA|nr:hypothetical protein QR680_013118 [Steinernema hermaphroditum]